MFFQNFFDMKAACTDYHQIEEINEEDDVQFEEETHESSSSFIPSFQMMFRGVKDVTMSSC